MVGWATWHFIANASIGYNSVPIFVTWVDFSCLLYLTLIWSGNLLFSYSWFPTRLLFQRQKERGSLILSNLILGDKMGVSCLIWSKGGHCGIDSSEFSQTLMNIWNYHLILALCCLLPPTDSFDKLRPLGNINPLCWSTLMAFSPPWLHWTQCISQDICQVN